MELLQQYLYRKRCRIIKGNFYWQPIVAILTSYSQPAFQYKVLQLHQLLRSNTWHNWKIEYILWNHIVNPNPKEQKRALGEARTLNLCTVYKLNSQLNKKWCRWGSNSQPPYLFINSNPNLKKRGAGQARTHNLRISLKVRHSKRLPHWCRCLQWRNQQIRF